MQVLVLLTRDPGAVVTRQGLFDQIWGGVPVGDDSLNRAIAGARKALALDPDHLELETIPRTGYRLNVQGQPRPAAGLSRRAVIAAAATLLAATGGAGLWYRANREEEEFDSLMRRGREKLAYGDHSSESAAFFARAASVRPGDGAAKGLLAYSLAGQVDSGQATQASVALKQAEEAKQAALRLDPREPSARLAEIILERSTLDFAATEDRLNAVLRDDPRNIHAMRHLWNVKQCVGRSSEALALVERATAIAPLAAANHFPRAQLLWIVGRDAEADRVIDRAIQYWPDHPFVRFARFTILAFTGRARAALATLEDPKSRPQSYSAEVLALWRANLPALDRPTPANVAKARVASLESTRRNPQLAAPALLTLSALGEVDAGFEVASAVFAMGGPAGAKRAKGTAWRFAPWLFTPPLAAMRADPRFGAVCDAAGLSDYWARRRVQPDYRAGIA